MIIIKPYKLESSSRECFLIYSNYNDAHELEKWIDGNHKSREDGLVSYMGGWKKEISGYKCLISYGLLENFK